MDLAAELIFHILELSVGVYDVRRSCEPEDEYSHLRNTALVCKAWVAPSQILLWRYISLKEPSHVQRWIDRAPSGQYTTSGLYISGRGLGDLVLPQVLRRTVGLETLHLVFFEPSSDSERCPVSAGCLALPELKDLTTLLVSNCSISDEGESEFPFRLRFFRTMHTRIHPAVVEELFRKSAKTLECLELEQQYEMDSPTLVGLDDSFPLVTANLRTLCIDGAYTSLVPFLASCTALKQLELAREVDAEMAIAIFEVLPTYIQDLYLEKEPAYSGDEPSADLLLDAVSRGLEYPSLSRLERLYLKRALIESKDQMGEEFRAKLKAHNINVVAVPEYYW